ncbi:hypothetical protein [Streptomyces sp. NBC_01207]|uniref:hypothetical protein n=1 Tax=Streptomyces sp. NBC_01207 TaxID=2903772 RepID=UPI002E14C827|nr:hypothetical protein OG457_00075 [Streptomyces sp. NBC_01207]WSR20284.1 hypothetical protein OG457_48005 [Streptomyces sp. NBC_01207]
MSLFSVTALVPAPRAADPPGNDTDGWVPWLRARLDPGWRTTEWRPDCWLFTGSVEDPRTSVSLCRTNVCDTVVSPAGIFCPFCKELPNRVVKPLP